MKNPINAMKIKQTNKIIDSTGGKELYRNYDINGPMFWVELSI